MSLYAWCTQQNRWIPSSSSTTSSTEFSWSTYKISILLHHIILPRLKARAACISINFFTLTISVSTPTYFLSASTVWHNFRNNILCNFGSTGSSCTLNFQVIFQSIFRCVLSCFFLAFFATFLAFFFFFFLAVSSLILLLCSILLSFSYSPSLLILLKCHH